MSINIPLVEALEKKPGYTIFMKDLDKKKRTLSCQLVENIHHYNVIALNSLLQKILNLGAFTIPCTIGAFSVYIKR